MRTHWSLCVIIWSAGLSCSLMIQGMLLVKIASDFMFHTQHRHVIWLLVKLTEMTQNSALPRPVCFSFLNLQLWCLFSFGYKCILMHELNKKASHVQPLSCWLSISSSMQTNIHSQWKPWWRGCIYTAMEDGQIPSGHQVDHRWFPCKTPLSDHWIYATECPPQFTL